MNPTLDSAADELYGGDPAEFIARRDTLAKDARAVKDRPLAEAIKALRRPTVGAWYVNVAARARLLSLVEFLGLGRELREAQAALDFRRVVALGPRRAELERRVLSDLTAHLAGLGVSATPAGLEEVRSTLRAALADESASAAVESGRLHKPLTYGELGDALAALAVAAADAPASPANAAAPGPAARTGATSPVDAAETVRPDPQAEASDAQANEQAERRSAAATAADAAALDRDRALRERAGRATALDAAHAALEAARLALVAAQDSVDRAKAQLASADEELRAAMARSSAADAERAGLS